MNSLLIKKENSNKDLVLEKQNQILGTNASKDELVIKEELVQDDLVSKC